jgi:Holliday junction resolvase RusA-like endonuclease
VATLRITIPIPPGELAINRKYEPHVRRRRDGREYAAIGNTDRFSAAFDEAVLHVRQAVASEAWRTRDRHVSVSIVSMWPSSKGDVDAPCKAVLDSLEAGGVVTDDRLCLPVTLDRIYLAPPGEIVVTVEDVGGEHVTKEMARRRCSTGDSSWRASPIAVWRAARRSRRASATT